MIDTKRLATDAAYWLECGAPEDATHCHERESGYMWWRKVEDRMYELRDGSWTERLFWPKSLIPRPQAPEADWVDGLPGVGCECEVSAYSGDYRKCTVSAYVRSDDGQKEAVLQYDNDWDFYPIGMLQFRPIRTPEQRQREELVDAICLGISKCGWTGDRTEGLIVANEILSRYNLEPKP